MINILYIMIIMFLMSTVFCLMNYTISKKMIMKREKNTSFECGFSPITSARLPFSIQFFTITLIFLMFDIEITFIMPMIPSMNLMKLNSLIFTMSMFFMMLIIGTILEWNDSSFEWIK
uniref:NADH-ubiquinone oxidoreductase chain 3 n=1 Tax=Dryinus sp. ZJUH_2016011 TaxID=2491175 RepID=A0A3Q8U9Z9_9HYME|nr:NADH dehydrogenase subunit 3 [Dryinus sp. ZJUH_2016011]